MSELALNGAIKYIYTDRDRTAAFRAGDFGALDGFDLAPDERAALEARDFVKLWSLDVHPVVLFHLSAVLNPREWYLANVVPNIAGIPNKYYDYYRTTVEAP
jgi:hypothetical protein